MRAPHLACLVGSLTLAAACGGGGGNDAPPALIPGGGIHDPGIDGVLNVYVIDADTDAPIAGATVKIGDTIATTDATGLVVAHDVVGAQTIVATASGHAAAMWIGADGANVTIPLDVSPAPAPGRPPQAQLAGTIDGWDALPAPAAGHVRAALVTYAQDRDLGARGNDLPQPPAVGNVPAAACVRLPAGTSPPCAWRLNARAGTIGLGLVVIDIDGRGTPDASDDVQTITGFAVRGPVVVVDGVNQSGVTMPLPPANSAVTATVDLGAPMAPLSRAQAVVGLDLGTAGVLRFSTATLAENTVVAPSLSAFPGTTYELIGVAREAVDDGTAAQSIVRRRDIGSPSSLAIGEWLWPPTGLASDRVTASFTQGWPDAPYIMELDTAAATPQRVLSVAFLDGTSQVTLPADLAPLPSGALTMRVTTLDTGSELDLRDFEVDALTDGAVRFAADQIPLN